MQDKPANQTEGTDSVPTICQMSFVLCAYVTVYLQEVRLTFFYICLPLLLPLLFHSIFLVSSLTLSNLTYLSLLFSLSLPPLESFFILPRSSIYPVAPIINQTQPQVEPALGGEEVDATKAGGAGEEAFTEEYVTGDVGLKEYDYSYRDYNEPLLETGEGDANMGPALSAVTDEGGVSNFASRAKKYTENQFQPTLKTSLWEVVFSVLSHDLFEFAIS